MNEGTGQSRRPATVVYLGLSVDGFIARLDREIDFLESVEPTDEDLGDFGFTEFMASVDALLMGRNTFDFVVDSGYDWPYGDTPVFVLTSRPLSLPGHLEAWVHPISGEPATALAELASRGVTRVYVDGGLAVQNFLRAGLVDELILTRVPVLIGEGITLFTKLDADQPLRHVETVTYPNGLVKSHYVTRGNPPADR